VLIAAEKRGLFPARMEQVEIIGADITDLRIPGYKLPATFASEEGLANLIWWQQALKPFFRDGLTIKPRVVKDKCIACGACRDACPMHVITIKQDGKKYAHIDDSGCIRCYCCHEMCPQDAIELHKGLLGRIVNW
jgi:ferredoxin